MNNKPMLLAAMLSLTFSLYILIDPSLLIDNTRLVQEPESSLGLGTVTEFITTRGLNVPFVTDKFQEDSQYKSALTWFGDVHEEPSLNIRNNSVITRAYYYDKGAGANGDDEFDRGMFLFSHVIDRRLFYDTSAPYDDPQLWDSVSYYFYKTNSPGSTINSNAYKITLGFNGNQSLPSSNYVKAWQDSNSDGLWEPKTIDAYCPDGFCNVRVVSSYEGDGINADLDNRGWRSQIDLPFNFFADDIMYKPDVGDIWYWAVEVNDKDSAAGGVSQEKWPTTANLSNPSTWAQFRFADGNLTEDDDVYIPDTAGTSGNVTIINNVNGAVTEDIAVGGGSLCGALNQGENNDDFRYSSGAFSGNGWGYRIYDDETLPSQYEFLNIQNQNNIADWPCFSRPYFKYPLTQVPAGKVIESATLKLYQFGNAGPSIYGAPKTSPTVMEIYGETFAVAGHENGLYSGFYRSGGVWDQDGPILVGLGSITVGQEVDPDFRRTTLFNGADNRYLLIGKEDGTFHGVMWNGSAWVSASIATGLGDLGSNVSPTLFIYNSELYLIVSRYNTESTIFELLAYKWNTVGSTWEEQLGSSTLADGLGSLDSNERMDPDVFTLGGVTYMVVGNQDGTIDGYQYNGTSWVAHSAIVAGLHDVGDAAKPDYFVHNDGSGSDEYMLVGEEDDQYYIYNLNSSNEWVLLRRTAMNNGLWAPVSFAQVYEIDGDVEDTTMNWNNAPQVIQNTLGSYMCDIREYFNDTYDAQTVHQSVCENDNLYFDVNGNVAHAQVDFDVTRLVAEAYEAGEPVKFAVYTADYPLHSGKYFRSSETSDPAFRPKLTVVWGEPGTPNSEPVAAIEADGKVGLAPYVVNFSASASTDSDGAIVSYSWNFDDGGTATGPEVSHSFTGANTYNVTLTVTDNDGAESTSTYRISTCSIVPASQARGQWWRLRPGYELSGNVLNCGPISGSSEDGNLAISTADVKEIIESLSLAEISEVEGGEDIGADGGVVALNTLSRLTVQSGNSTGTDLSYILEDGKIESEDLQYRSFYTVIYSPRIMNLLVSPPRL